MSSTDASLIVRLFYSSFRKISLNKQKQEENCKKIQFLENTIVRKYMKKTCNKSQ